MCNQSHSRNSLSRRCRSKRQYRNKPIRSSLHTFRCSSSRCMNSCLLTHYTSRHNSLYRCRSNTRSIRTKIGRHYKNCNLGRSSYTRHPRTSIDLSGCKWSNLLGYYPKCSSRRTSHRELRMSIGRMPRPRSSSILMVCNRSDRSNFPSHIRCRKRSKNNLRTTNNHRERPISRNRFDSSKTSRTLTVCLCKQQMRHRIANVSP